MKKSSKNKSCTVDFKGGIPCGGSVTCKFLLKTSFIKPF